MTKDNHFQQYGYDHYLKSPKRPREDGFSDEEPRSRFRAGPGVMTLALLLTGAVFATVIVTSYPSGDSKRGEIPIVKADLRPVKTAPDEPGGMDIPNRDSTILARVGEAPVQGAPEQIENLLESPDAAMMSREEAIESAMAEAEYRSPDEGLTPEPAAPEVTPADVLQKIEEPPPAETALAAPLHEAGTSPETKDFVMSALEKAKDAEAAVAAPKPALEIKQAEIKDAADSAKADASDAMASAVPSESGLASPAPVIEEIETQVAEVTPSAPAAPVESLIEAPTAEAEAIQAIEPASGMASPAPKINAAPGGYYVQLASVPNRAGTEGEWKKLQKKFGSLIGGMKYRVQEASLGERGTFYRIQAGPISKESADELCREVKAISPGGCLVVKK